MPLTDKQNREVTEAIEPIVESLGLDLISIKLFSEQKRQILQVLLDTDEGINLEQCAKASREISLMMDVEDFFNFNFNLEVSSPGIYRELTRPKDFIRFKGFRVKGKLIEPFEGDYTLVGDIVKLDEQDMLVLNTDHGEQSLPLSNFETVHLHPKF